MSFDLARVWLLLLAGCSRSSSFFPLSEVPIAGGSEAMRQLVESELTSFSEAIEPQSIELSEIAFEVIEDEDIRGRYRDLDRRITLDEELVALEQEVAALLVPALLRHELCHALDYQTELALEPHEALDAYARRLGEQGENGVDRGHRSEAFATFCALGPILAASLAEPCPGEDPLLAELGSFAMSEVWRAVTFSPPPKLVEPPVPFVPLEPFAGLSLEPTNDPDVLLLEAYRADGSFRPYALDLRSGEQVELDSNLDSVPSVVEGLSAGWALEMSAAFKAAGWPDQALLASYGFLVEGFDRESPGSPRARLLWFSGERWSPFPLCLPEADTSPGRRMWDIFTAREQVWYAHGDGQQVRWAPVTAQRR